MTTPLAGSAWRDGKTAKQTVPRAAGCRRTSAVVDWRVAAVGPMVAAATAVAVRKGLAEWIEKKYMQCFFSVEGEKRIHN